MRANRSARALMTTNKIHLLAGSRRVPQLIIADRNQGEREIAV